MPRRDAAPRSTERAMAAVVLVVTLTAAACGGSTEPSSNGPSGPGQSLTLIALNDTVQRAFTTAGQVDTLRFVASAALRIRIDLQQLAGNALESTLRYTLVDSTTGEVLQTAPRAAGPTELFGLEVGSSLIVWKVLPRAATYLIIVSQFVSGSESSPYVGAYRLRVVGSDPRPENAPVALLSGDTLTESIDHPGDVDEFLLMLGGRSIDHVLGLRAQTGRSTDTLVVEAVPPFQLVGGFYVRSAGTDTDVVPTDFGRLDYNTDTLRVRVRALRGSTTGPYRLTYYRVNRSPERVPALLQPGDTVSEALDYARDIDEFTFAAEVGRQYSIAIQGTSGRTVDTLELLASSSVSAFEQMRSTGAQARLLSNMSEPLSGGALSIRVQGVNDVVGRGEYRLVVVPINPKPETAPEFLVFGDTVTERLEHLRDVDVYDVPVQADELVVVYAQIFDSDTATLHVVPHEIPGWNQGYPPSVDGFVVSRSAPALRAIRSIVYYMPAAGTFRLGVAGTRYEGQYRLAVVRISRDPETANPAIVTGVATGELLDPPGDSDEYTFQCAQGQEIAGYIAVPGGVASAELIVTYPDGAAFSGSSGRTLYDWRGTGRLKVFTSGTCRASVEPATASPAGEAVPYQFIIVPISRAPEQAAQVVQIGDTIDTELIQPSADVDEFQLNVAAGSRFQLCLQDKSGIPDDGFRWLHAVISQVSGFGGVRSDNGGELPCTETLTALSGPLLITVDGSGYHEYPYRLVIRPVP
jgi:hypothetical protein